jgi:hypothetical protein
MWWDCWTDPEETVLLSCAPKGGGRRTHTVNITIFGSFKPVFRIHRIHMFLGLPDPDPLVRGMDPDPAPDPDPFIIMQK